jgi:hypothetical protein
MGTRRLRRPFIGVATSALVVGVAATAVAVASGTSRSTSSGSSTHGARIADRYSVDIQAVYTGAGEPLLGANFFPNGALATPHWSICRPPDVSACTPTVAGQELRPGSTRPGTVFEASATYDRRTYTARSAVWLGTVRAISPPRLIGRPAIGATVAAHGARWSGGWQTDPAWRPHDGSDSGGRGASFDYLRIEACRTRDGKRCVTISAPNQGYGFSNRPPVVAARFAGWYLFAFDERFAHDTAFAGVGLSSPEALPPLKAGPTIARSAPAGPITATS